MEQLPRMGLPRDIVGLAAGGGVVFVTAKMCCAEQFLQSSADARSIIPWKVGRYRVV